LVLGAIVAVNSSSIAEEGLHGHYYKYGFGNWTEPFVDDPEMERVDSQLDLFWEGYDSIHPKVGNVQAMSVRWFGMITPSTSGEYVFELVGDDGVRLLLDGEIVIDSLYKRVQTRYRTQPVAFAAGKKYEIAVELFNIHPPCGIKLAWKEPGASEFEIVPSSALSPELPAGAAQKVATPMAMPSAKSLTAPTAIELSTATDGAPIYYTTDGTEPSRTRGLLYTLPIVITRDTTVKARAFKTGMAASEILEARYPLNPNLTAGLHNWRTGNSLTGNALNHFPAITMSAGYKHRITQINGAGAATRHLWKGFSDKQRTEMIENAPYDYYITQPEHEPDLAREREMTGNFYREILKCSPNTKLYIYANWLTYRYERLLGGKNRELQTPQEWVEDMESYTRWFDELRVLLQEDFPDKTVQIIPVGQALLNLKKEIEAGRVPGMKNFFEENIRDDIHATLKGAYLVGLVHHACLYKENPVGLLAPSTMLTAQQQLAYQRIAWNTAIAHPHSGVMGEPVAAFSSARNR
jgi:hypothetical protein